MNILEKVFVCFAAEDRYTIAEPIVYHLKNYGIDIWYDRHNLLLGDNRIEKNLNEGASECRYAVAIFSKFTKDSVCTMEELAIIKERVSNGSVVVFPILFGISPSEITEDLLWIKDLIFKEANQSTGTREICNHIVCRITGEILKKCRIKKVDDICDMYNVFPCTAIELLKCYQMIDHSNLNSRITLLYSVYIILFRELQPLNHHMYIVSRVFQRLISELSLNLAVDYREIWLLENSLCILADYYLKSCTESRI